MPRPILIDTDMGVDDAVGITLALSGVGVDVVGLCSVGGNVTLDQATANVGRLLSALGMLDQVPVARGLDQAAAALSDASHVFGADGLGGIDLPVPPDHEPGDYLELYERLIDEHGDDLVVVAIGPLTNLAGLMKKRPGVLERAGQIVVMGGAVWCPGNVTPTAEFNFYRDPEAAAAVLSAGLPVTVVPLDVTRQVAMDESHIAHLSRSGTRSGQLLAEMIQYPMTREVGGPERNTFLPHDALAVGILIWSNLFMRSKMGLAITVEGDEAGRCKPMVGKDRAEPVRVVISVNAGEFLENLLESLCHEKFVV